MPDEIAIAVEVKGLDVRSFRANTLLRASQAYAVQLAQDLAIPKTPHVSLERAERTSVMIGGARVDVDMADDDAIVEAIHHGRMLFIEDDLVVAFGARVWPGTQLPPKSLGVLRNAMRGCVERNLPLTRLIPVLSLRDSASLADAWPLVLDVHAEAELLVEFAVPVDWGEWWPETGARVQQTVVTTTGLPCPSPRSAVRPELGPNEVCVRINAARLPIRHWRSTPKSAELAAVIAGHRRMLLTRDGIRRNLDLLEQSSPLLAHQLRRRVSTDALVRILDTLLADPEISLTKFDELAELVVFSLAAEGSEAASLEPIFGANENAKRQLPRVMSAVWSVPRS